MPTPNWKQAILVSPEWPKDLVIPQDDELPEDSEPIQESSEDDKGWKWELWRHPDGHCYYLKVWPTEEADLANPDTPGAMLSVMEAFQFLVINSLPRDIIADLLFEHPDFVKTFAVPPSPGLN